jgi:hypothetical protein
MKITEIDVVTNSIVEREATELENEQIRAVAQIKASDELVAAQQAVDKAALLERLGITADEAALLLS